MNYASEDADLFHYEYRAGHWWLCIHDNCDGEHHYYVAS
jgi:hypothetical protein